MSEVPDGKCGYTYPEDHEVGDDPNHQSCCFRDTVADADRCAWHVASEATKHKTIKELRQVRESPNEQSRNRPVDELLDGAKLSGVEMGDAISLEHVSLRLANFQDADLRGADLSEADLPDADLSEADLRHSQQHRLRAVRLRT